MATKKSDEKKTAGADKSRTQKTTEEAVKDQEETPTTVEERGDTDAKGAAKGSVEGGVRDGDVVGGKEKDTDEDDVFADEVDSSFRGDKAEVDGALGTVAERNLDGDEYDVPWAYLTADQVGAVAARTSDTDDKARSWTAQHASGERENADGEKQDPVALVEVQATPGQTFRVSELPNREVAKAAGIDWEAWVTGLPVRADVPGESPRRGIPA